MSSPTQQLAPLPNGLPASEHTYVPSLTELLEEDESGGLDPRKYWYIVRKHLRLLVIVWLVVVTFTIWKVQTSTPLYSSGAVVLIKTHSPVLIRSSSGDQVGDDGGSPELYFNTQFTILRSRSLAAKVIQDLGLLNDKAFMGTDEEQGPHSALFTFVSTVSGFIQDFPGRLRAFVSRFISHPAPHHQSKSQSEPLGIASDLINHYLSMLTVRQMPETSLAQIEFTTPDPDLSARLANAHADAYGQQGIELHSQASGEVQHFLQQRLVELQNSLSKSEVALNNYRREKGIVPGLISLDGKETIVMDRLKDLSRELTAAEVERIGFEAQVQAVRKHNYLSLAAVANNGYIQRIQQELNELDAEQAGMANQFKPDYPPRAQLMAKSKELRAKLDQQVSAAVDGVMSAYRVAQDKENEIRSEIDNQKSEVLGLNDAAVQYTMLQREVDTNRELTNNVLQKMKDVGLEAEDQTSNISIVDRAEPSPIPSSPNKLKALIQASAVALATGLALAVLLEYMNNTLVNPEEAARYLRLSNLGVVPEFETLSRTSYLPRYRSGATPILSSPGSSRSTQVAVARDSFSLSTEAYRSIRTGIILSRAGSPPKVTMIASAMGGEGKTVTAVNTAVMFGKLGQKVLLVDGDLRRPKCHTYLGLENFAGLTDVLVGSCEPMDVVRPTPFEGLSLVSSGKTPPNCAELLGSSRMRETLALLVNRFDCVIIDSPPLIPISDGLLLATMVDGVVLVIDSTRTPKKQIRLARARLDQAHAKIFGFVLNKMHSRSYYYHHYHRGYYAGYQQEVG